MTAKDVTRLLERARSGDGDALGQVYEHLYRELKIVARAQLRHGERRTLNTGALINESFLKLVDQQRIDVESREHFLALAARAMRQIMIDYFRRRSADKRGGPGDPVALLDDDVADSRRDDTLLVLDEALDRLEAQNERLARVVECKFFGGMTYEEIGLGLGLAPRTVRLEWRKAKAWLTLDLEARG